MNIIEDELKDYEIVSSLTNGSAPLKGIKIRETAEDCVTVSEKDGTVYFTHGKDRLEVRNASLDHTINTILECSREYELWEKELYHKIFTGCSLQEIIDYAYPLFQNPIFFVDETDRVLARTAHEYGTVNDAWDHLLETGYLPFDTTTITHQHMMKNIAASRRRGKNVPFLFSPPTRDIDNRGINYRIYSPENGEVLGTLIIIENETPVTLGMLNLSEILTDAVDEWMNMHRADHPFKTVRDLVKGLIEDPEGVARKELLGRYLPVCEEGYKLAVITGCGHIRREQIEKMITDTLEGSLAYKYGEEVIAIIPLGCPEEEIRKRLDMVLYYQNVRVGLSYPFSDTASLNKYYHQAQIALTYGSGKFTGIDPDMAMRFFTAETEKGLFGTGIVHPEIEKLKEYDAKHGGELCRTLYYFLRNERSLIASARALNIHRNSLIYRIDKIKQLTELDLEDPDVREYLLFSYRILQGFD